MSQQSEQKWKGSRQVGQRLARIIRLQACKARKPLIGERTHHLARNVIQNDFFRAIPGQCKGSVPLFLCIWSPTQSIAHHSLRVLRYVLVILASTATSKASLNHETRSYESIFNSFYSRTGCDQTTWETSWSNISQCCDESDETLRCMQTGLTRLKDAEIVVPVVLGTASFHLGKKVHCNLLSQWLSVQVRRLTHVCKSWNFTTCEPWTLVACTPFSQSSFWAVIVGRSFLSPMYSLPKISHKGSRCFCIRTICSCKSLDALLRIWDTALKYTTRQPCFEESKGKNGVPKFDVSWC